MLLTAAEDQIQQSFHEKVLGNEGSFNEVIDELMQSNDMQWIGAGLNTINRFTPTLIEQGKIEQVQTVVHALYGRVALGQLKDQEGYIEDVCITIIQNLQLAVEDSMVCRGEC